MCGISYKLGNLMNKVAAKNFYYSCVYSVLSYCICVWGGVITCTQRCEPLARLQAKIVKNVFSRHYPNSIMSFQVCRYPQADWHLQIESINLYVPCDEIGRSTELGERPGNWFPDPFSFHPKRWFTYLAHFENWNSTNELQVPICKYMERDTCWH